MSELKTQNFTNPFINVDRSAYLLISAGEGPRNVKLPDDTVIDAADVKRDLGYPQLFAWNLEPKPLLKWVEYLKANPTCPCKLVVDSGAYSMWSRGKEFNIDEYINFLNSNDVIEQAFWVAEADVIPGKMGVDPTEEERAAAPEKSWQNYLYMIERVKWPKKVVPIFHQGEDFKHLKRMLEYKFQDGDHIPYIGISPRNDVHVNEKMKWYENVWKIIKESSNPDVLTHNFGMTTISLMEQYPSMSSDSTSWVRSASFGNIMLVVNGKIKTVYVSNRNPDSPDHINNQPQAIKDAIEQECKYIGHGFTIDALINDDSGSLRPIWNLIELDKWRKSFKYEGNNLFKNDLW